MAHLKLLLKYGTKLKNKHRNHIQTLVQTLEFLGFQQSLNTLTGVIPVRKPPTIIDETLKLLRLKSQEPRLAKFDYSPVLVVADTSIGKNNLSIIFIRSTHCKDRAILDYYFQLMQALFFVSMILIVFLF